MRWTENIAGETINIEDGNTFMEMDRDDDKAFAKLAMDRLGRGEYFVRY